MDYLEKTLKELANTAASASSRNAVVGFDGFVDKIVHPVDQRFGPGDDYQAIETIAEFGSRISAAAGKSANIEMYQEMEKLGGNGPIMANAVLSAGFNTRYIGALGKLAIHPVFQEFADKTNAISITDPGVTTAAEFKDGKIMLGNMAALEEVTYPAMVEAMGEGQLLDMLARADLIAMVNWTMLPYLTQAFNDMLDKVFPNLPPHENRRFFFDLADPAKRSEGDIRTVLKIISRYQAFGAVTLGLNLSEAQQIFKVLGHSKVGTDEKDLKQMANTIRQDLEISCVVVHPTRCAACATKDGVFFVEGPYCEHPKITTGAGDHFNAGFSVGQVLGLSPEACLTVAVSFSGSYVRTAKSPSLGDISTFIHGWDSHE
ncbi:PfkB family carbohydrate kinase [Ruficoccus sp. ZRK36]|uniref:PfkB family carbohydrate kinase n=1 Tax=Ruficoccus sp. ZRK36 TaxID=2866311 RepID=UPI001C72CE14|nr:PfkB family carbohydrate kinase [Ruficoccus sp. ZRK36]QYY34895.1 carbohydrate kinase family protein [Ruficoccus sp. ZRK36]